MLDRALEEAGIDRNKAYVTNAVKHFKFVARGKFRLHQKPTTPRSKRAGHGMSANWPRSNLIWWWRWAPPQRKACSEKSPRSTRAAAA
jgi:hypothetical protein